MSKDVTPLMRQYNQIKNKYPETILLFRMGDFFETFDDDAVLTAKICGITLTKRHNGKSDASPLAGFPHHQLDTYLPKLVKAGCRVAVCEQIEDPKKAKGIVKRDVVEVVTPGVSLYDKLLDSKKNNYVAAIYLPNTKANNNYAGLAICDVSTGEFLTGEISLNKISEVIDSYLPTEIIYSKEQAESINQLISSKAYKIAETKLEEWIFELNFAKELLLQRLKTQNFKGFGIDDLQAGISAAGAILHYVSETQKAILPHINSIKLLKINDYMLLDYATRRNLEILYTMDGEKHGSLIKILDRTLTPPGSRLLKKWLNQPLNSLDKIHNRLNAVEAFFNNINYLEEIHTIFHNFGDLERLVSRLSSGKATTRDIVTLAYSLERIPQVQNLFAQINNKQLSKIATQLNPLSELTTQIRSALLAEPAIQFGTGNIFKTGYNQELDSYVQAKSHGKHWIKEFQENERISTDIPSLKVSFNNVFGYFIEVTKTHIKKVPEHYERRQTLTNAERYITPELKEFEEKILNAEYKITDIEHRLFNDLQTEVSQFIEQIQFNAFLLAQVDCLQSFATTSLEFDYVKPIIDDSDEIEIIDGRHPVVEQLLPNNETFCPNNTKLNSNEEQIHIITGPNMAGKSCYLRQTALVILLGQIGCFVPAKSAHFGLIDRIFTRVGAQDNITTGESTFLVEMQEMANILHNATNRSLVLLDEVGRGTATFDGVSIAWAIAEHLHNEIGAKTLFATHYHELNELTGKYEKIANYRVEVIESHNKILFTHKVIAGASDHSFGIYVANIAGLPQKVTSRADEIMQELESSSELNNQTEKLFDNSNLKAKSKKISTKKKKHIDENQLSIFEIRDDKVRSNLLEINVNNITPMQAIQHLEDLQKIANQ